MKTENLKMLCILFPISVVWALLSHFGALDRLKNTMMDLRFKFRGEIQVQADQLPALPGDGSRTPKVTYVDFDQRALSSPEAGERPWDRKFFAKAARYLLDERVGARSVGYDFIFSNKSMSKMVPEENIYDSESKIGDLIQNGTARGDSEESLEKQVREYFFADPSRADRSYMPVVRAYTTYYERERRRAESKG